MNHKYTPTGRVRKLQLKELQLCSSGMCISHATHAVLYRRPLGGYVAKYVCADHLLSFLAPEMWRIIEKLAAGITPMKAIFLDANKLLRKVE